MSLLHKEEKKVEYLELVYDLVFVYMVGRNNSILHHFEGGFVAFESFMAYVLCTLAVIQIWNFSTFYINMFGTNGWRNHICLFLNMYLIYFMGEGTRQDWQGFQTQYHIAWALILINIAVQYALEARAHRGESEVLVVIRKMIFTLLVEAGLVLVAAYPNETLGIVFSSMAILFGIGATVFRKQKLAAPLIDFAHLTERAMLYVVFTFGETMIALAIYFNGEGKWSWNTIYYSLFVFLSVAAMLLSYGLTYDHLIDREKKDDGLLYFFYHIFIIFSINNISCSLEFMPEEEIELMPKMIFMIISYLMFYFFLFVLFRYNKTGCRMPRSFAIHMTAVGFSFAVLMILFRQQMYVNLALTVLYSGYVFAVIYKLSRKTIALKGAKEE